MPTVPSRSGLTFGDGAIYCVLGRSFRLMVLIDTAPKGLPSSKVERENYAEEGGVQLCSRRNPDGLNCLGIRSERTRLLNRAPVLLTVP